MRQNHEWLRQTHARLRQFGILPHPFCVSLRQPLRQLTCLRQVFNMVKQDVAMYCGTTQQ
jgi:hypothetical protein